MNNFFLNRMPFFPVVMAFYCCAYKHISDNNSAVFVKKVQREIKGTLPAFGESLDELQLLRFAFEIKILSKQILTKL